MKSARMFSPMPHPMKVNKRMSPGYTMERLTNLEFNEWVNRIERGAKIALFIPLEDAADLILVKELFSYRYLSSRSIYGIDIQTQDQMAQILKAMGRLRAVERKVIAARLGSGFNMQATANLTNRSKENAIHCLRTGIRTLRIQLESNTSMKNH
jgi:hypothetical protein